MGVRFLSFGGFSPRRKPDALPGAAIRLGPFGTGRKRPPSRPPSRGLSSVFGVPFGILPILRAADVSTLVFTTGPLLSKSFQWPGFFFLLDLSKNWLGKRLGVCRVSRNRLIHICQQSASVSGSGGQPMSQPTAGPSTPLWGGRFGCPGRAGFAFALALAVSCFSATAQTPQTTLERTTLRAGQRLIDAQIARSSQEQGTGLMHREAMPRDEGMLFPFDGDRRRCVWMRDTPLPLTVAFLDAQGHVLKLVDLHPMSEQIHCSDAPARFVLEMNRGWFIGAGIEVGSRVLGDVFDSGSGVPPASCWPLLSCGLPPQTP